MNKLFFIFFEKNRQCVHEIARKIRIVVFIFVYNSFFRLLSTNCVSLYIITQFVFIYLSLLFFLDLKRLDIHSCILSIFLYMITNIVNKIVKNTTQINNPHQVLNGMISNE